MGFSNSISFATVTPSLVTVGAPNFFSRITFLPFGPSVTFTASANLSTPAFKPDLASALYSINFDDIFYLSDYLFTIPKISLSRIIKYSSPPIVTSVPLYFP